MIRENGHWKFKRRAAVNDIPHSDPLEPQQAPSNRLRASGHIGMVLGPSIARWGTPSPEFALLPLVRVLDNYA